MNTDQVFDHLQSAFVTPDVNLSELRTPGRKISRTIISRGIGDTAVVLLSVMMPNWRKFVSDVPETKEWVPHDFEKLIGCMEGDLRQRTFVNRNLPSVNQVLFDIWDIGINVINGLKSESF